LQTILYLYPLFPVHTHLYVVNVNPTFSLFPAIVTVDYFMRFLCPRIFMRILCLYSYEKKNPASQK